MPPSQICRLLDQFYRQRYVNALIDDEEKLLFVNSQPTLSKCGLPAAMTDRIVLRYPGIPKSVLSAKALREVTSVHFAPPAVFPKNVTGLSFTDCIEATRVSVTPQFLTQLRCLDLD